MSVANILKHAEWVRDVSPVTTAAFAQAVISLLSEAAPCGYELPVVRDGTRGVVGKLVEVPASWAGGAMPEDARAMARMLLRAADEAEQP